MNTSYNYQGTRETNQSSHISNFNATNLKLNTTGNTNIESSNLSVTNVADIQTNNFNVLSSKNISSRNNHNGGGNIEFDIGSSSNLSFDTNYGFDIANNVSNTQSNINLGNLNLNTTGNTTIAGSNFVVNNDANINTNNFVLTSVLDSTTNNKFDVKASIGYGGSEYLLSGEVKYDGADSNNNIASNMIVNNLNLVAKGNTTITGSNLAIKDNATIQTSNMLMNSAKEHTQKGKLDTSGEMVLPWDGSKASGLTTANYLLTSKYVGSNLTANSLNLIVDNDTILQDSNINANNAIIETNTLNLNTTQNKNISFGLSPKFDSISLDNTERNTYISLDALHSITNNHSSINSNNLSITTKSDVNISGSNINSNVLNANIGGNLNIESKKDSKYGAGVNLVIGTSQDLNDYQSMAGNGYFGHRNAVSNQSGISADFIDMNVTGNINLKGAYIQGSGNVSTNTISSSDIINSSSNISFTEDSKSLPTININSSQANISKDIQLTTKH